jgi:hypothetical protein
MAENYHTLAGLAHLAGEGRRDLGAAQRAGSAAARSAVRCNRLGVTLEKFVLNQLQVAVDVDSRSCQVARLNPRVSKKAALKRPTG